MTVQKILLGLEPRRENLLKSLKEINRVFGFVSLGAMEKIGEYFGISLSAVFSAASFYDEINVKPPKAVVIEICDSPNCQLDEASRIVAAIENFFRQRAGDEFNPKLEIRKVSCLGRCGQGPIMVVNGTVYDKVDPGRALELIAGYF